MKTRVITFVSKSKMPKSFAEFARANQLDVYLTQERNVRRNGHLQFLLHVTGVGVWHGGTVLDAVHKFYAEFRKKKINGKDA